MNKDLKLSFNNEKFETGLTIFDLILLIIKHKFQIIISGAIFFIFGFLIYLFVFPYNLTYEVKIKINPPSSNFIEKYQNKLGYDPEFDRESSKFTKEYYIAEYIEEFKTYDALRKFMSQKFEDDLMGLNHYHANKLINKNAKRFYIKDNHIQFSSTDIEDDLKIIDTIIYNVTNKVAENISLHMQERLTKRIYEIETLIAEDTASINASRSALMAEKKLKKDFLLQQLKIATELNISSSVLFENKFIDSFEYNFDIPYYLRGTSFIEAELLAIDETPFYSEIYSTKIINQIMRKEINTDKKNTFEKNISTILNDLSTESSNLIRINVSDYDTEIKPNLNMVIPFGFLILGLIFQIIYLIFRNEYTKKLSSEK